MHSTSVTVCISEQLEQTQQPGKFSNPSRGRMSPTFPNPSLATGRRGIVKNDNDSRKCRNLTEIMYILGS